MMRTQIALGDEERRLLDAAAARTGLSMSALIRNAVVSVYGGASAPEGQATIAAVAGAWSGRDEGGRSYVERVRSGARLGS